MLLAMKILDSSIEKNDRGSNTNLTLFKNLLKKKDGELFCVINPWPDYLKQLHDHDDKTCCCKEHSPL